MTLAIIPRTLPSLEAYADALCAVIASDWSDAAAALAARYPSPSLTLTAPAAVEQELIERYEHVPRYPYATVTGSNLRVVTAHETRGGGVWQGQIEVDVFVQESNRGRMARLLQRYAAAVWLIAINNDPLAGARIDYETVAMETSEPARNNANRRAVSLV